MKDIGDVFFCTFIIVVRQYHDRKHVFYVVPQMLALGFDLVK